MSTTKITVPSPLSEALTFRWFIEYAVDNHPAFQKASAIAKVGNLLNADLDNPGDVEVDTAALELLRSVLLNDEQPFELPSLVVRTKDEAGEPTGEPTPVPPRVFLNYVRAILGQAG